MHWKTFENSKRQWKKPSFDRVQSITVWIWSIISNKPQIKRKKQQHWEQVVNTLLTQIKQKRKKIKKKDEVEKDSCKYRDFYPNNFGRINNPLAAGSIVVIFCIIHWVRKRSTKEQNKKKTKDGHLIFGSYPWQIYCLSIIIFKQ